MGDMTKEDKIKEEQGKIIKLPIDRQNDNNDIEIVDTIKHHCRTDNNQMSPVKMEIETEGLSSFLFPWDIEQLSSDTENDEIENEFHQRNTFNDGDKIIIDSDENES